MIRELYRRYDDRELFLTAERFVEKCLEENDLDEVIDRELGLTEKESLELSKYLNSLSPEDQVLIEAYMNRDKYPEDIRKAIEIAAILRSNYPQIDEYDEFYTVPESFWDEDIQNKINYLDFARYLIRCYAIIYYNGYYYVWLSGCYVEMNDEVFTGFLHKHLLGAGFPGTSITAHCLAELRRKVRDLSMFRHFPFNKHDDNLILIPVKNGVLWWNNGEIILLPSSPYFGFTYRLNVKYIPGCKHDRIRKFLESLVNPEDLEILYEIPAACLVRKRFPYAYFLYGTGANGKSTYLNLITDLLGEENVSHVSLQDLANPNAGRFKIAALVGKLANIFPDLPSYALIDTSIFKAITGDDCITIERKFKDPFTFRNSARPIFSANAFPRTKDDSDAFWRRWIIVKFPFKFKNNPNLLEELTTDEEKSAFLDAILKRLPRILECNPTINSDARSEWIRNIDSVRAFLEDCTVEDDSYFVIKEDLYNAYLEYCQETGYDALSKNSFFRRLSRMYPTYNPRIGGKQKRAFKGLKLLPKYEWKILPPEEPAEVKTEIDYEIDTVAEFFDRCTENSRKHFTPKQELYNAYVKFCSKIGKEPVNSYRFFRVASGRYSTFRPKINGERVWAYIGVKLLPEELWNLEGLSIVDNNNNDEFDELAKEIVLGRYRDILGLDNEEEKPSSERKDTDSNLEKELVNLYREALNSSESLSDVGKVFESLVKSRYGLDNSVVEKVQEMIRKGILPACCYLRAEDWSWITESTEWMNDPEKCETAVTIKIVKDVETEITGLNGEVYRVKQGDVITVPLIVAYPLIKHSVAEIIKIG